MDAAHFPADRTVDPDADLDRGRGVADPVQVAQAGLEAGVYGAFALIVMDRGVCLIEHYGGCTRTWDAPGRPARRSEPVGAGSLFDLASVSKLFTAAALLAALEENGLTAETPAAELLPEFREPVLRGVTVARLLNHTAGFAAEHLDRSADPGAARFRRTARPIDRPGSMHRYSCVGYIWAGLAIEVLTGQSLPDAVRDRVCAPLGMSAAGFGSRAPATESVAATEFQPGRGMVHGEVHDETAWALGGSAGNAGVFATARDLALLGEALRLPPGEGPLPASVVRAMTAPVVTAPGYRQALGPRVGEDWMAGLSSAPVLGHTGFTGTALATSPGGGRTVVFLTNRVHPDRSSSEIFRVRRSLVAAAGALRGSS